MLSRDTPWGYATRVSKPSTMSLPLKRALSRPSPPAVRWLAVAAGSAAILATYWDGAWHTEVGRDSTFAPPHILLYASIALAAAVVVAWALFEIVAERSVWAVLRHRALVLSGIAVAAIGSSAVLDVLWHVYFGRDSVLWSPPHLLGIIGTVVLVVGFVMSRDRGRPLRVVDGALCAVLLGTAMLPVMEFDSRVPQFAEGLYLPVVVVAALAAAWVIDVAVVGARVITAIVAGVVLFRAAIWAVLSFWGWPTVDVPFALLALVLLDLRGLGRIDRFSLAAMGMSGIQIVTSAVGLSSVELQPILPAALVVIAGAGLVMLAARRRGRVSTALVMVALVAGSMTVDAAPARAHDPGQGTDQGEVAMSVERAGTRVAVTAEVVSSRVPLRFESIVARRAGQLIEATADLPMENAAVTATLELDDGDIWFIYAEYSSALGPLESWITVEPDESRSDVRPLYEPPVSPVNDLEFIGASVALYVLMMWLVWFALRVVNASRRSPTERVHAVAAESS